MPLAVDYQGGIENAWSNVITFVPKLLAALLIVLVGYFVAKLVASILDKVLERVGFDRAVERGGVRQVLARSKYDPSDILAKLVFWTIMLLVLQLAFGVFGANPVSDLLKGLIAYLPNVFVAILILVIAAAIARAVTDLLSSLLSSVQGGELLAKGAGVAVLVFAVFAALDQLQIAPRIVTGLWYALLAAVVGSVVVAVGGGGIRTMQRYWERTAGRAEARAPEMRDQVRTEEFDDRRSAYRPTP
jgi:Conserved TM helix